MIERFVAIGVALILSGALWRLFSGGGAQDAEGDGRTQVVLAIIYAIVGVLALCDFRPTGRSLLRNPELIALLILACVSPAWADSPDLVIRRALGLLGASLFGVFLAVRFSFAEQLHLLRWAFRIAATGTIALLVLSPSRALSAPGGGGAIRGVFPHKNILGAAMALAFLVEWYLRSSDASSKTLRLLSLGLYGVLLIISDSMSSIATVILTLLGVWVVRVLCGRYRIPIVAVAIFVVLTITAATITGVGSGDILELLGRSSDLTGRTELWSAVTDAIVERPILGYGFSGFWKGASSGSEIVQGQIQWSPAYSHNGYLEIILSLGIVGLLIAMLFLAIGFSRAWKWSRSGDETLDSWPLAMLMFIAIHNLTECSIAWQNCLEWSVCVAAVIGADPRQRMHFAEYEEVEETVADSNQELVTGGTCA
jgi:O-antigen ligase